MKKLLNIFIAIGLIACISSCSKPYQNKLRATAEQINQELPIDLGNDVCMDSVTYDSDDNTLVFHYSNGENINSIHTMRNAGEAQRRFLKNYLSSQDANEFTKLILDAQANICFEFTGRKSGEKVELTFSADEIKELVEGKEDVTDDRTSLANILAITNAQCPLSLAGDNLVMSGVALGDENIEFTYVYNPEVLGFAEANVDDLKNLILPELRNELSAQGNSMQLELMKRLGIGVKYTFEAEGKEPIEFTITLDEINL